MKDSNVTTRQFSQDSLPTDCYWFVKEEENEPDRMAACCVSCGRQHQLGWFWEGSVTGYGDYDLDCSFCGAVINKYDDDNEEEEVATSG